MGGHVFLSYSRSDRTYAEKLAAHIQDKGIPVWYDYSIDVGDRFASVIQNKIDECNAFVVLLTPTSMASTWVNREISYAAEQGKPILPVQLIAAKPHLLLSGLHREDVTGGHLPAPRFTSALRAHFDEVLPPDATVRQNASPEGFFSRFRRTPARATSMPAPVAVPLPKVQASSEPNIASAASDSTSADHVIAALDRLRSAFGYLPHIRTDDLEATLACALSGGHLLMRNSANQGRSSLAVGLGRAIRAQYQRVTITPDTTISDLSGGVKFDEPSRMKHFERGPVFTNILVLEDIQLASHGLQASLIDVLSDRKVTHDGLDYLITEPFICFGILGDGPIRMSGRLIDQFSMSLPERPLTRANDLELVVAHSSGVRDHSFLVSPLMTPDFFSTMKRTVSRTYVHESILGYVADCLNSIRQVRGITGISDAAIQAISFGAKAIALLSGRHYVIPSDIQQVMPPVLAHRLRLDNAPLDPAAALQLVEAVFKP